MSAEDSVFTQMPAFIPPHDEAGNYELYGDIRIGNNSDWKLSKTFPDPHACMTCHTSK